MTFQKTICCCTTWFMFATIVSSLVLNLESAKKGQSILESSKSILSFSFDVSLPWLNGRRVPILKTSLKRNDLQEGKPKADVNGKSIVLTNTKGKLYAMDSVCSHEGGPLEEGTLTDYNLTCVWHQGIFDIRTAKASPNPPTDSVTDTDLKSYTVIVDDKSQEISILIRGRNYQYEETRSCDWSYWIGRPGDEDLGRIINLE